MKREPGFYWVRICERHPIDGDGWTDPVVSELRGGKPGWQRWSAVGCDVDLVEEDVEVLSERLLPPGPLTLAQYYEINRELLSRVPDAERAK